MSKTEQLGLYKDSIKRFITVRLELEVVFNSLKDFDQISSLEYKKVGIYKHLKKLIPCFDILFKVSKSSSTQSLLTLERMIADNYAILYLLTSHSTKEEQFLRYYLFLLDATRNRSLILTEYSSNMKIKLSDQDYENEKEAIISDDKASNELLDRIRGLQQNLNVNEKIITKSNWKFKDINSSQNSNRFEWTELYTIARIPTHHSKILQDYHSTFVHGLGISLMIGSDETLLPFKISTLDFCSILMSLIIKIILNEYYSETKNVILNLESISFMNKNWNNWK